MLSTRKLIDVLTMILGLLIMALGVSVSVRADLGVTPISCVPYVYSLSTPFTLGEMTIFMNIFFILGQMAILRKRYSPIQLLQLPAVVILGYCIDFTYRLVSGIEPSSYLEQLLWLLVSCALLALGVFLVVKANLTYIPGDGLIVVIADTFKKDFGKTKMCFDSSMVVIGLSSSLLLSGRVAGIREGTIIAALLVGYLIQLLNRLLRAAAARIEARGRTESPAEAPAGVYGTFPVITISREYGSGGHEIGQQIAKKLGFTFYDRELIDLTAQQSGFTEDYIKDREQKISNSLLHELYAQNYAYVQDKLPPTDLLFLIQSKIIRDVSAKQPCVIVGRCANFVLKDNPSCFNIFIHANEAYRKRKIVDDYKAPASYSSKDLEQMDHERANYCLKYTGGNWRDVTGYHLTLDSSLYTTEQLAKKIIELFRTAQPRLRAAA
ncbi:membrane protein-like protein [Pseudodesulfovibrio mercurii]|uniref:Membrane protein-like protein n=1 Tax=Pseudodesulfovibrio mercurii TaxID=641491 RepID=F0JEJ1_9BACT|nr:cytidylate kinase family protein [Pseudodesulfovibrio mercurii]EGB14720.1 membrane protein-like protein [Pseudodesulfovibrio mercurii]